MIEILTSGFRITALFLLLAFGFVLIRSETKSFKKNILIFFILCLAAYLLAYWEVLTPGSLLFRISFYLSVSLPFAFWLLSKALFNDNFRWSRLYWILLFTIPVCNNLLYYFNQVFYSTPYQNFRIVPYLMAIVFIVLVVYEAIRDKDNDLVLSRLKSRNIFVIFSSFLALFSVYFFLVDDPMKLPPLFDLFQHVVICIFIFLFFITRVEFKNVFVASEKKDHDTRPGIHKRIIDKLIKAIEDEKQYNREGLTITQLASELGEKEYLLRRAINHELGYTNFNGFLNHYRIKEACHLIQNHSNEEFTFQEIAYNLGYQSVATFNRAFKNETGKTPGEYAKTKDKEA